MTGLTTEGGGAPQQKSPAPVPPRSHSKHLYAGTPCAGCKAVIGNERYVVYLGRITHDRAVCTLAVQLHDVVRKSTKRIEKQCWPMAF